MVVFYPSLANAQHAHLTLPYSKTNPFRKVVSILLATQQNVSTCPVTALSLLYALDPQPPSAPLSTDLDGLPLLCSTFILCLKAGLARCSFDVQKFSGHSFLCSTALSAAAAGYSDYGLQLLGHWRSNAY